MKRAAFTLGLCVFTTLTSARATADCTGNSCADTPHHARPTPAQSVMSASAQHVTEYLDLWLSRQVLLLRYGAQHPDVIVLQAQLTSRYRALPPRTAADDAQVLAWLRSSHLETEARLAEMGTRCGPQHIDLRGAELRRDVLAALIEALARGEALPALAT